MATTRTDIGVGSGLYNVDPKVQAQPKKSPQQICEEKGGFWDGKQCLLYQKPQETPKPTPAPTVKPTGPEVFKDMETGALSGVTMPNGVTTLGMNPTEVKGMVGSYQNDTTLPAGTQLAGTAQTQANQQARMQQLMQMAQQGMLSPQELQAIQQAPIDWGQALTAGSVGNLPSVLTNIGVGAAAGAGIGAVTGLGIGAVPGAIIGGVGGLIKSIWGGTQANIKSQQSGEIAATKDVLAAAKTNMKALTMVVSKDPSKAEEAINLYYNQLAQVQRAQRKLQMETQGNLNKYMNDGTQDLSDFELFLQPGGYAEIQLIRLQNAIQSGQPATDAEILQLYQEDYSNGTE